MANAIPVNSDPEATPKAHKRAPRVAAAPINASPVLGEDGVVKQGEYAAAIREGLGDASDFTKGSKSKVDVPMTVQRIDTAGNAVQEVFTHRAVRTDH